MSSGREAGQHRLAPAARRRLRTGSALILVVVAAVAGAVEVQQRRELAAGERRLAGALQLSAAGPWGFLMIAGRADGRPSASVTMDMKVLVQNDGPREVTVTHASAGGFRLVGPVRLPAGASRELVMQQDVDCAAGTPPRSGAAPAAGGPAAPGPLQITARTSGGRRTVTIARPPYSTEHAALACELRRDAPPDGGLVTSSPT